MLTNPWVILALLIVLVTILAPRRTRYLLTQIFTLPLTPFRDLAEITSTFMARLPGRISALLEHGGIHNNRFVKAVGALVTVGITALCVVADLDLTILTFSAFGLANKIPSLVEAIHMNPADAGALALLGCMTIWGIVLLDASGKTEWLPIALHTEASKCLVVLTATAILASGITVLILVSRFRADMLVEGAALQSGGLSLSGGEDPAQFLMASYHRPLFLLLAYLTAVTILTSIIGLACLPAALVVLFCAVLALLLVPCGILHFIGRLGDRMVTVAYNIALAVFDLIVGALAGLSRVLSRMFGSDDNVDGVGPDGPAPAAVATAGQVRQTGGEASAETPTPRSSDSAAAGQQQPEQREEPGESAAQDSRQFDTNGFNPLGV